MAQLDPNFYTEKESIVIGPQYARVSVNKPQTRLCISLLRVQSYTGSPFKVWLDIKVVPELISALQHLNSLPPPPPEEPVAVETPQPRSWFSWLRWRKQGT